VSLVLRGRIERNLTEEQLRRRILNLIRPQQPRRQAPLLRRTLEGRWGVPADDDTQPIDPEERVVIPAPDDALPSGGEPAAVGGAAERKRP